MAQQIEFRRDTAAHWTSANPILAQGEPGLETDTKKFKIGDGTTAWTSLAYVAAQIAADAALTGTFVQKANNLSDLASAATARTNLGLAAIAASGSASDLSAGSVPAGRFGATTVPISAINASGTASSSTFLRGDGSWQINVGATLYLAANYQ